MCNKVSEAVAAHTTALQKQLTEARVQLKSETETETGEDKETTNSTESLTRKLKRASLERMTVVAEIWLQKRTDVPKEQDCWAWVVEGCVLWYRAGLIRILICQPPLFPVGSAVGDGGPLRFPTRPGLGF